MAKYNKWSVVNTSGKFSVLVFLGLTLQQLIGLVFLRQLPPTSLLVQTVLILRMELKTAQCLDSICPTRYIANV